MWRQSETPILKRARITRENLVALSKPFARSGGSLGGNEGNETTRKAVNSGSSLQTNPVRLSLSATESRRGAEPRMWNPMFSSQHGGSILSRPWNGSDRTQALSTTTNVGQYRVATHRRRVAVRGRDPRRDCLGTTEIPNRSSESRLDDTERKVIEGNTWGLSILRPGRIPFAPAAVPVAHTDGPWYRSRRGNTTQTRTIRNSGTESRLCSGRNS